MRVARDGVRGESPAGPGEAEEGRADLYTQFDSVFFEKTRLSILTLLYTERVVEFGRLKKLLGTTDGALSSHVGKLLHAGYVTQRRRLSGQRARTAYALSAVGQRLYARYVAFLRGIVRAERGGSA